MQYPPRCEGCGRLVKEAPTEYNAVTVFVACPACPPGTRVLQYMQATVEGRPPGWPRCMWCSSPAVRGRMTCANLVCKVKERELVLKRTGM